MWGQGSNASTDRCFGEHQEWWAVDIVVGWCFRLCRYVCYMGALKSEAFLNFSVPKLFSLFSSLWTYISFCLRTSSKKNIKTGPSLPESGELVLVLFLAPEFYGLGHSVSHQSTVILTSSTCLGTDYLVHAHYVPTHPRTDAIPLFVSPLSVGRGMGRAATNSSCVTSLHCSYMISKAKRIQKRF